MSDDRQKRIVFAPIAGLVEACIMQPFDTIKVLKQSNQYPGIGNLIRSKGVAHLYKGLTPFMGQMFVKYGIRFSSFEALRGNKDSFARNFMAGVGAGILESIFITPFELVKTTLQTRDSMSDPLRATKRVINDKGLLGLYRGFSFTCFRQGINQGSNFTTYMMIRNKIIEPGERPGVLKVFGAGLLSGSIGPLLNNPFDVLKTRYMNPKYKSYSNVISVLREIIHKEGVSTLWKGIGLRIFRVAGGQAVTFSVIEQLTYLSASVSQ